MATGRDVKPIFAAALSHGLLFCISVFLLLAILVWRLPKPTLQNY
jgi:hypothetical protein